MMHLTIDGSVIDKDLLQSEDTLYEILEYLPDAIGMQKISRPKVVRWVGKKPHDWGYSGYVLIAESHIAIHTFVEWGYISMDVYSCKPFDAQVVLDLAKKWLKLERMNHCLMNRGLGVING